MPEFVKTITINHKPLNFAFSKVISPSGVKFFVNVFDNLLLLSSFEVKNNEAGDWEITLPVPQLIQDIQPDMIQAIKEFMHP
jgi:hypothetical protein